MSMWRRKTRGRPRLPAISEGDLRQAAQEQAAREDVVEQWVSRVNSAQATNEAALAALERAQVKYKSEIDGVNTTVANMEAQLKQALYYLDNTTLTAPA